VWQVLRLLHLPLLDPSWRSCVCWPLPQLRFKCRHLQQRPGVIGLVVTMAAMQMQRLVALAQDQRNGTGLTDTRQASLAPNVPWFANKHRRPALAQWQLNADS
jgi:hypothetical protein